MIRLASLAALAAAAIATSPALAQDPAPVVAAELGFAADARTLGVDQAFHKWSTPDAILIGGGEVANAQEAYPGTRPFDPQAPSLVWWPNWAGIARSGDMGFSTGPVERGGRRGGHYFTIWTRQADGGWKWVYDGGSGADSSAAPAADTAPAILPPATVGSADASTAMAEVRTAEAALAQAAARDQKAAHLAVLADDGRLYVAPRPPAIGRADFAEALSGWPEIFTFGPTMGGGASRGGDMAWTYGEAAWKGPDGADRSGHYVRLWRKSVEGWRLAFAQLVAAPPPQPAPPAG